jgi:hypothetical protein
LNRNYQLPTIDSERQHGGFSAMAASVSIYRFATPDLSRTMNWHPERRHEAAERGAS